jgi:hypothetical protein
MRQQQIEAFTLDTRISSGNEAISIVGSSASLLRRSLAHSLSPAGLDSYPLDERLLPDILSVGVSAACYCRCKVTLSLIAHQPRCSSSLGGT